MQKQTVRLTVAQFANLHHVNKRTLHYYDNIGLFSPRYKGENGYRYYDYAQSIDFAYIRMLKAIHMSVEEIKEMMHAFDEQKFLQTVARKQKEIDGEIKRLKQVKAILARKRDHLLFCRQINDMDVTVIHSKREYLWAVPYPFEEQSAAEVFPYIQSIWPPEQYQAGVGSYIALEKIQAKRFDVYDGLYTPAVGSKKQGHILLKPEGDYVCGYLKGKWDRLPQLYEKMLDYARAHQLQLTGYAFERELNDFAIADEKGSVTQVVIPIACCQDES